ncbi:hypothetical protein TrST_g8799 [Triparma strigata]|uniref:Uncharacterized protein n=1 Tax=Triparma strigata TaxID=1606541 RepID=A0A9W7F2E5_9STRA|nr:hypothetical protein TrST_g8799 [Triparma strigata]
MCQPPSSTLKLNPSELKKFNVYLADMVGKYSSTKIKDFGDADAERCREFMAGFLSFVDNENGTLNEANKAGEMQIAIGHVSTPASSPTLNNGFSSTGRIKSQRPRIIRLKNNKVAPMMSQTSTALSIFSSPEANLYSKNYNKDLDFENEKVLQMDNVVQRYTDEEDAMITASLGLISGMEMKGAIAFRDFKTSFSATKYLKGYYNSKEGDIYGMSKFTVRGDVSRVAARITNYWYQCMNPAFGLSEEFLSDDYVEIPNSHSAIYCQAFDFPSPLSKREVIVNIVWKRLSEKSIIVAYNPLNSHPLVENKDGDSVIRGSFHAVYHVTQLDDGHVETKLGFHINFGGNLPRVIVNGFIVPNFDRVVSHHQAFFGYSILEPAKDDGKLLGELFVNQIKSARKRGGWKKRAELGKVGVDEFLYCSVAMRELLPRYPWLGALLHEISLNQVKVARTVTTALSDMKDQDAINLAKGLSTIILSTTEASAAVDHWIGQNSALEEFEKDHEWIRSFFVEIAQHNLNTSNLGLRLRVFGGALLSTVDLVTDIYMTYQFFNTESEEEYGKTNAILISLTVILQIICAYVQNFKSTKHFFQDAICTLIGFKPALDAYRVGSGAEQEKHQIFDPLTEMTMFKGIETVFEAIPSSIVQIYALLSAKEKSLDAVISILVSAATIAYTSSVLTYDWDTSPTKRTNAPLFYGFVPEKALPRAVCFLSMMSLSFAHVLLMTSACALLALTNTNWLMLFLGVDMGVFFVYKIVQGDFLYFVNVVGVLRFVISLLLRITIKIMMNFTMLMQLRHPQEVGGLPVLVSIFASVVGSFVSVHVYSNYYSGDVKVDNETLQTALGSLVTIWFVSAVTFASVIKREYLHTFFNMDTASTFNKKVFLSLREDQDFEKSDLLTIHPDVYKTWGDELLKPWTIKNWNRWEEEKPAWFTDKWIEAVPNEYIPFEWRVKYKKTKGRVDDSQLQRRRGSISVRELVGGKEER